MKVVEDIDSSSASTATAWRTPRLQHNGENSFEGLEKDPRPRRTQASERLAWLRSVHAAVAIQAGQAADARKTLEKLADKQLRRDVFVRSMAGAIPYDVARVFALTGDAKDQVVEIEKQMADEKVHTPGGLPGCGQVDRGGRRQGFQCPAPSRSSISAKSRLRWQEQYDKGEWVSLTFDPAMVMWQADMGKWTVENEHSVLGDSEYEASGYRLRCNAQFSESFEFECNVEGVSTWGGYPPHSGLIVRAAPYVLPTAIP